MAKEIIKHMSRNSEDSIDFKLDNIFMKVPFFGKIMRWVTAIKKMRDFIIFILISPKTTEKPCIM